MGDTWHTQNIQTNEVIGENEKCVFYFTEKIIETFWSTQYMESSPIYQADRLQRHTDMNSNPNAASLITD